MWLLSSFSTIIVVKWYTDYFLNVTCFLMQGVCYMIALAMAWHSSTYPVENIKDNFIFQRKWHAKVTKTNAIKAVTKIHFQLQIGCREKVVLLLWRKKQDIAFWIRSGGYSCGENHFWKWWYLKSSWFWISRYCKILTEKRAKQFLPLFLHIYS